VGEKSSRAKGNCVYNRKILTIGHSSQFERFPGLPNVGEGPTPILANLARPAPQTIPLLPSSVLPAPSTDSQRIPGEIRPSAL